MSESDTIKNGTPFRVTHVGPDSQRSLLAALEDPHFWPDQSQQVELVETHISWVFLTRRFAFKLKKPVGFDFLDFRTLAARKKACEDEVRLNRRLAPDVYLEVVPISRARGGTFELAGKGEVVDYLVKMRRLAEADRLDARMEQNSLTVGDSAPLIRTLTEFYQNALPLTLQPSAHLNQIESQVRDNRLALLKVVPELPETLIERVSIAQFSLIQLMPELLLNRVRDGRVIEGHGDLRPEHIYLTQPPVIVDCIEFNSSFRQLDVADELCFLAMECDRLQQPALGTHLLSSCLTALEDQPAPILLAFYKSYRATVRAKVAALRAPQQSGINREKTFQDALIDLQLAESYLAPFMTPRLVVVGGLMGSGKSTVAAALHETLGYKHLQTDKIRQEQLGTTDEEASFGAGKYSAENRERVYEELFERTERQLTAGVSVVLDGTFTSRAMRERAARLAERHGADFCLIWCACPEETARERISARRAAGEDPSEARADLLTAQMASTEFPERAEQPLKLDTTLTPREQLAQIFERVAARISGNASS